MPLHLIFVASDGLSRGGKANTAIEKLTFASATIEVYPEQKVISTGLYGLVRHPMYTGGLFLFVGMCLALGSWWNFLVFLLMVPALIWRIFDEEKLLAKELPGYLGYQNKVRRRLIPFVW